ncbi:MAG: hypothetical protein WD035_09915 [Balneolaceae bacterium]
MNVEEKKSISFGLFSFEIESYSFDKPPKDFNKDDFGYQIQFRPVFSVAENTVTIEMKVQAQFGKKAEKVLGFIHTLTTFKISALNELVNDQSQLLLPKNLAVTLLSIALSTTRGAMAAKSEGNILAENVLPLINPEEMYESSPLKDPIELEE